MVAAPVLGVETAEVGVPKINFIVRRGLVWFPPPKQCQSHHSKWTCNTPVLVNQGANRSEESRLQSSDDFIIIFFQK